MVEIVKTPTTTSRSLTPTRTDVLMPFDPWRMMGDLWNLDPFRDFPRMRNLGTRALEFNPDFDLKETDGGYVIKADVPGVAEKDLDISLHGNRLQIAGSRKEEKEEKTDTYYTCERSTGAFTRVFTLPEDVDLDSIKADLKDGVLNINVKKSEKAQVRHVPIKG